MGKKRWMLYLAVGVAAAAAAVITFFAAILPAAERSGRVANAAVVCRDAGDSGAGRSVGADTICPQGRLR